MDFSNPLAKDYLFELYQMTSGDMDQQVSMYDVGTALGLEKEPSSGIAQDLIIDGLLELKTLSGGVAITTKGLEALQVDVGGSSTSSTLHPIGSGEHLDTAGREAADMAIRLIQDNLSAENLSYRQYEEIAIDLKTAEIQLLSSNPSTPVIKALFVCLADRLKKAGFQDTSEEIRTICRS